MHNLGYIFQASVEADPDRIAVIQDDKSMTYGELDRQCDQVADFLKNASGLQPGDRLALLYDNHYTFIQNYFGALRAGCVVVPVNSRLDDGRVRGIMRHSGATICVAAPGLVGRANELWSDGESAPRMLDGEELVTVARQRAPSGDIASDQVNQDVAIQAYTSGSTGEPKGCLLSHEGQIWNVRVNTELRGLVPDDKVLTGAPLCHKNAMASAVKPSLFVGATLIIQTVFSPGDYLELIARHDVTITTGVPTMYRMLVEEAHSSSHRATSVRYSFIGSSSVPEDLRESVGQIFPNSRVREGYGSTEGGPISLIQAADGSPGLVPVSEGEIAVRDPQGRSVTTIGERGELWLRNPGVLLGYFNNPEVTRERLQDGWYRTGDMVRLLPKGKYEIVGRTDDMIITGGENIFPEEVARLLRGHPSVADAYVLGIPDHMKGTVPVAFVVPATAQTARPDVLRDYCLENGPAFAHPRKIWLLDQLPLASTGKIDRNGLAETAARLAAEDPRFTRSNSATTPTPKTEG